MLRPLKAQKVGREGERFGKEAAPPRSETRGMCCCHGPGTPDLLNTPPHAGLVFWKTIYKLQEA